MRFAKLVDYLGKLEATTKRLEMTSILAELFKEASEEDIAPIIYLTQERLGPAFDPIDFGIGEALAAEALAKATGKDKDAIKKLYKQHGDYGIVAEKLISDEAKRLTVAQVFERLKQIATASGEGTVAQKTDLLSDLLQKVSGREARYVLRIPLGRLRLGIGDPTVMEGLSWSKAGDKSLRPQIERAYNVCSDLGEVARIFKAEGVGALAKIQVQVGNPVRMALAERAKSAEDIVTRLGKCAIESKFDGFRCISGHTPIYVQNKGLVSVKDVAVGDSVLTHTGAFKRVIAVNKRQIHKGERLHQFQTYLGDAFKITGEHRILCLRHGREEWLPVEQICPGDELVFPIPFMQAEPLASDLKLRTPAGYTKHIAMSEKFYQFLGFWIGDGFTNSYHNAERIGLTFNARKEQALCDWYERLVRDVLGIQSISRYSHNGGLNLCWRDETFKEWLSTHFRREWRGKMLPAWFAGIGEKDFSAFLKGWIQADGSSANGGGTKITTKEPDLAAFAQLLALSRNTIAGIKKIRVSSRTYYNLIMPGSERRSRIQNGRILIRVLRNERIKYPDPRQKLYNLQVEDDESYCTPMACLHNCQIHKKGDEVRIFSRNLEETTAMFSDIAEGIRTQIKAKTAILEGEALSYDPETGEFHPFQVTMQRKRKYDLENMTLKFPLRLVAFDLLYLDGKDFTGQPYSQRHNALASIIADGDRIQVAQHLVTQDAKEIEKYFMEAITGGLEGIMAKRLDSKYQAGARNFNWIKLKRSYQGHLSDTVDGVVVGYLRGRGMRARFGIGALLVAVYDDKQDKFATIAKIGTGFSDEEWPKMRGLLDKIKVDHRPARVDAVMEPDVWVEPKYVIEMQADEITRSPIHTAGKVGDEPGYALRFPRVIGFIRTDKKPEDATSIKEILRMFEKQGTQKVEAV